MAGVYIKTNIYDQITAIDSDIFITDLDNWHCVDVGEGDKYTHAQSSYLDKPITDENGDYNYCYINGNIEEILEENKPSKPYEPTIEDYMLDMDFRLSCLELGL